jgi:lipopolysaccharide heptosyltransferase II
MEINNTPKKILAVHTGGIGDLVMLGPALRLLREAYAEGATIDLLVSPMVREIAERYPYINNIIYLDTAALKREFMQFNEIIRGLKSFFELRRKKYDITIIFQPILSLLSMFRLSFFMAIIRPKKIFGRNTCGRGFFINNAIQENRGDETHEICRMVEVVKLLHNKECKTDPHIFVLPKERERASQLLRENGICDTDNYIVMAPGFGKKTREWDSDKWVKLGDALTGFYNVKIVIVGGHKEDVLSRRISSGISIKPINFTGKISLFETAAVIEKAKIFIGNDSGLMHIAATLGTYVIALFGPGDINRIRPFCSDDRCKVVTYNLPCAPCYKQTCTAHKCMEMITVDDILTELDKILSSNQLINTGKSASKGSLV